MFIFAHMDLPRKKIIIIPISDLTATVSGKDVAEDVTDYRIRKEMLDRLCSMGNISRVVVTHDYDEKRFLPMLKAVEILVFVYCKTACSCMASCDELMESLPHSLRRKEVIFSLDQQVADMLKVDYLDVEDFLK